MTKSADVKLPRPALTIHPDRDSAAYWETLEAGEFKLQACNGCGTLRWPPRAFCNRCHDFETTLRDVARTGRIVSWTRTHQVFAAACREIVPYYVVQVALDAQPDILMIGGWLAERAPQSQEAVTMELVQQDDGFRLPCWKPLS